MSLQIKSLAGDPPVKDTTLAAPANDFFNVIPTANEVYSLYIAVKDEANNNKKTAIVKGIRLLNTHSSSVTVSLYFNRPNTIGQNRRRLLAPANIAVPAGGAMIDEGEITLEPGDSIQAKASVANVIQYVISGVERDVV